MKVDLKKQIAKSKLKKKLTWIITGSSLVGVLVVSSAIAIPLTIINSNENSSNVSNGNQDQFNPWKPSIVDLNGQQTNELGFSVPSPEGDKNNAFLISTGGPKTNNGGEQIYSQLDSRIINDKYLNLAKRSYSINFSDDNSSEHMGTAWILDYKLTDDNSYPLTWYFATNAHVAYNLVVNNDYNGYNSYYQSTRFKTSSVKLTGPKNPDTKTDYSDSHMKPELYNTIEVKVADYVYGSGYTFHENPEVKTIFIANDFLKSKPSDYNKALAWQNIEETADFAVVEINFSSEDQAKTITNNYANWKENEKFKLAKSLITDNNKPKENDYYVLGYPQVTYSGVGVGNIKIQINQPNNIDLNNPPETGTSLVNSKFYSTFSDPSLAGIMDGAIGFSWFKQPNPFTNENFLYQGLFYIIRQDALKPGASGSMVMNGNLETLGIQFAYDDSTDYGITQALRSDGYNYNGLYKWYNNEPYDLIYGGFSNQKKSYKDYLFKAKGNGYKTNLFPNGNASS
ncbi:MAG: hypothetical protein HDR31_02255 [Mycoplasma sp.]|nr:hypothetical protein [Mycoplasma sp.]